MNKERQSFCALGSVIGRCIYVVGGCYTDSDSRMIEKYDTERDIWVILDVKLDFALNEFHHVFTMMEGGLEIFKREEKKKEVPKIDDKPVVPRPILEGEVFVPPIEIEQPKKEKKPPVVLSAGQKKHTEPKTWYLLLGKQRYRSTKSYTQPNVAPKENDPELPQLTDFKDTVRMVKSANFNESFLIVEHVPGRDVQNVLRFPLSSGKIHSHTFSQNFNPSFVTISGSVNRIGIYNKQLWMFRSFRPEFA